VKRAVAGVGVVLAIAASAAIARAHQVGLSRGEYVFSGDALGLEIIFARGELLSIAPTLDTSGDGKLEEPEVDAGSSAIAAAVVARISVSASGAPCTGAFERAHLVEEDGVAVRARFRCPAGGATARVALPVLEDLAFGHRHIARARSATGEIEEVLYRGRAELDVPRAPPAAVAAFDVASSMPAAAPIAAAKAPSRDDRPLAAIVRHLDLVAFAAALVLGSASTRARIASASALVAAVAVGLALGSSGSFCPPTRITGVATALALAFVGIEDVLDRALRSAPSPSRGRFAAASLGVTFGLALAADTSAASPTSLTALAAVAAFAAAAAALATTRAAPATRDKLLRATGATVAVVAVILAVIRLAP
jgi:hypothetical protein